MADNTPGGDADKGAQSGGTEWYKSVDGGVDAETIGLWQNKGLDVNDPAKIAVGVTKMYRAAEGLIGARADHDLLPVPKAPDKGDWNAVWTKLGKPAKAEEYDLSGVKFADGSALDDKFVSAVREAAFKANLPKGAVPEFTKAVVAYMDGQDASEAADRTAKGQAEAAELAREWGTTPEALKASPHMKAAQAAIIALGGDAMLEAVNALEGAVGYKAVMNMFRGIASKIGEDRWITGEGNPGDRNVPMTAEQAADRKRTLRNDNVWVQKFLSGDKDAAREMAAIDAILNNARQNIRG